MEPQAFRRTTLNLAVAMALAAMAAPPAQAVTNTWICTSSQWQQAGCWTAGIPQASHDVVVQPNPTNHTVVTLNAATGTANAHTLLINSTGAPTIKLDMTGGTLNVATYEFVGTNGKGSFAQSAGHHSVGNILFIGELAGGNGSYSLSGTGSLWADALFAGSGGTGSFSQSGGSGFTVGHDLRLGNDAGAQGSYNMTGGALGVGNSALIGVSGSGSFAQSAGTQTIANGQYLGFNAGGTGTYTLSGSGQLNNLFAVVGRQGTGTFTQNGGTHAITGELVLSEVAGGSGTYHLNGGTLNAGFANIGRAGGGSFSQGAGGFTVAGDLKIGTDAGSNGGFTLGGTGSVSSARTDVGYLGTGGFIQNAGTHTVSGLFYVGTGGGSQGSYELKGGTLSVANAHSVIGHFGSGNFVHSAGTFNAGGGLWLGTQASGQGSYTLSGTGSLNTAHSTVGDLGQGTFQQTGGSHSVADVLNIGAGASGTGSYNLNGGALNAGTVHVGWDGTGTFSQQAGDFTIADDLGIGNTSGSSGTFNLSGGNLTVGRDTYVASDGNLFGSAAIGHFNQTGGAHAITGVLHVGTWDNAWGTYNLSSGSLATHDTHIGQDLFSHGTFNHSGGSHSVVGGFYLGYVLGGEGYYNLSGTGVLTSWNAFVGREGKGVFNQSGGAHTITGTLTIAANLGSSGSYVMEGGALNANAVALNTGGTFEQTGGTVDFATFTQAGGTGKVGELGGEPAWYIGRNAGSNAVQTLSAGVFSAAPVEYIGYHGTGTFNQSGGTHTVLDYTGMGTFLGQLYLGYQPGSSGSYNLTGGTLRTGQLTVGVSGSGSFTQSGGSVLVNPSEESIPNDGRLWVGGSVSGVYTLNGGSLEANELLIGGAGTASFAQQAGVVSTGSMTLGASQSGTVTYTLGSGSLTVTGMSAIARQGQASFIQSAGTHGAAQLTIGGGIGNGLSGVGRYELSGTGQLTVGNELVVGIDGSGTFIQHAGTVAVTAGHGLRVGRTPTGSGTYDLRSGTFTAVAASVGENGPGSLLHSGGTFGLAGDLILGDILHGNGSYVLSGDGQLNVGGDLLVARGGTGAFNQMGGTSSVAGSVRLGGNNASYLGNGAYTLADGVLNASGELLVGEKGAGTFTQTGGTATIAGSLILPAQADASGTYHLAGGVLNLPAVQLNAGGTFDMTGGTLNTPSFVQQGGTVTGALRIGGTFDYHSGTFSGRLINDGEVVLHVNDFAAGDGLENNGAFPVIGAGRTVTLNGAGLANNSFLELAGGTLTGGGPLINNALLTGFGTLGGSGGFSNQALFTQTGGNLVLGNTGANGNSGNLDLAAGRQLQLAGATLTNSGSLNLNGASVTGSGTLTNAAGGTLAGRGTVSANFANAGIVLVESGTTRISPAFSNSGLIRLTSDAASLTGGTLSNSGSLRGSGQVGNAIANSGTVEANGGLLTLGGALTNVAAGTLSAPGGATLLISQGLASNAGVINLTGGVFDNNSHALANPGQIKGYGRLRTGGLSNDGLVGLTFGLSDINGAVTNNAAGKIIVSGGAATNVTFYDPVINNGELRVSTGSRAVFFGLVSGSGGFTGGGAKQYEGGLSLGSSPAVVTMEGEVEIVGSQVVMELAGPTPGNGANNHDKTLFTGPVTLTDAPDLVVVLLDGYRPLAGTRFDLFDWDGGVTGTFDLVLPTDYQWDTTALYTSGDILVTAAPVPEPETWAMLLAGLGLVGWRRRGRFYQWLPSWMRI